MFGHYLRPRVRPQRRYCGFTMVNVQRTPDGSSVRMGSFLHAELGPDQVTVGFAFNRGGDTTAVRSLLARRPEKFRQMLADDIALWTPIVKALGLKIDRVTCTSLLIVSATAGSGHSRPRQSRQQVETLPQYPRTGRESRAQCQREMANVTNGNWKRPPSPLERTPPMGGRGSSSGQRWRRSDGFFVGDQTSLGQPNNHFEFRNRQVLF
jgi:hypothetical protein